MSSETRPLPAIARSAYALFQADMNRGIQALAVQALSSLTLAPELGWKVDFEQGVAVRDVADAAPEAPVEQRVLALVGEGDEVGAAIAAG